MQTLTTTLATAILCLLPTVLHAQGTDVIKPNDPTGTWRWEYDMGGEQIKDSLRLELSKGNKLTGSFKGREGKWVEIQDAKMEGDKLSFLLTLDFQGTALKLDFEGKVKGDDIDGKVNVKFGDDTQEFPWTPKRSVQMEDVVGTWQLRIDAGDRTLEPVVTISKVGENYRAQYTSGQEVNVEATNLKVEKNQLCFNIATTVNGTQVKADYKGRPYGDNIQGDIAYVLGDNSGNIEFTGTRKTEVTTTVVTPNPAEKK